MATGRFVDVVSVLCVLLPSLFDGGWALEFLIVHLHLYIFSDIRLFVRYEPHSLFLAFSPLVWFFFSFAFPFVFHTFAFFSFFIFFMFVLPSFLFVNIIRWCLGTGRGRGVEKSFISFIPYHLGGQASIGRGDVKT